MEWINKVELLNKEWIELHKDPQSNEYLNTIRNSLMKNKNITKVIMWFDWRHHTLYIDIGYNNGNKITECVDGGNIYHAIQDIAHEHSYWNFKYSIVPAKDLEVSCETCVSNGKCDEEELEECKRILYIHWTPTNEKLCIHCNMHGSSTNRCCRHSEGCIHNYEFFKEGINYK